MTAADPASLINVADSTKFEASAGAKPAGYFLRHLHFSDHEGNSHHISEANMLAIPGPKIVLGEPGMGKSRLIHEVGRRLEVKPITAIRFMLSKDPGQFIVPGKPLLIDGLDEAMARHEGDAVDKILAQLEEAGSPEFILSCRAREWQARSVTNLRQIYGADPIIFTLQPLSRTEAREFLIQRFVKADSDHVLDHLDEHGLVDLYRNPLTLGLMGQVAEHDTRLPATRAALFERVCALIWPEHDPLRQDSGLGRIIEDKALSAAGAMMAGLLFSGAEATSIAGPAQLYDGDVRLADLETLPAANEARALFSSKLFDSVGIGRAKPIHRVIAEYLGARWLAQQAVTPRAQRRILSQLNGSGAVPASLRGLHAWLAFHSPAMAERVIAADPFGVLRYGETATLTATQADCMFDALCTLAEVDPYFRAQDWDSKSAAGLMVAGLRHRIRAVIGSEKSNAHLRSLLIEGLKDTALAGDLAATLEAILFSGDRFYREREAAAHALFPNRDIAWWRQAIANLRDQGTENSTRLATNLIERIACDVGDDVLVTALFAWMGVTISPLPRVKKCPVIRSHPKFMKALPRTRLCSVLDLICEYSHLVNKSDYEAWRHVVEIVSRLIVRAIDENVVGSADSEKLWRWLGVLAHVEHYGHDMAGEIKARLDRNDDLRHAIQHHALYVARRHPAILMAERDLEERLVGLTGKSKDVIWFLERLANADNKNPVLRAEWCDFVRLGYGRDGFDPGLRVVSQKFQRGDKQLEAYIHGLEHPKEPTWKRKHKREEARREKQRRIESETRRRHYVSKRAALREGELNAIIRPAQAYLGLLYDVTRAHAAADRISEWLGSDLGDDGMTGLEAVLHRSDLPTPAQVTQGFANGTTWNYCYAIMAGLLARYRSGKDFADLNADVLTVGLLLCLNEDGMCDEDVSGLRDALEKIVIPNARSREAFARLWIELSLVAGCKQVRGLYMLAHDERWQATGAALAGMWLKNFPSLPENIELELVDCLTHSGATSALASISAERASTVFRNFDHMLGWLAIDFLVRFDTVQSDLAGIGARNPRFLWFLRNRIVLERRGNMLPLTIAQAKWTVSEFRAQWPYAELLGSGSGDTNPYDATNFLRALINRIANDTSVEASEAMQALVAEPGDSYSELIRHMAAEQRQKRAEENFAPLPPKNLGELLTEGPPTNADDLKSLVLEELAVAQKVLTGDDLDQVRDFWNDSGVPYNENRCRDRLTAIIGPELMRYGVHRITEADMPATKRADLAFACGKLQLPMEVKGQWHLQVWEAATDQLDLKYLIDWRSEQRGIYCVLWFGNLPAKSGRRLKTPPKGIKTPKTADEMRKLLIGRIPETRRAMIDVVVLDLTAGKSL